MQTFKTLIVLVILMHGLYSIYASLVGKKYLGIEMPIHYYLRKYIFKKDFDKVFNLFIGILEVIVSVAFLYEFLK